MHCVVVAPLLDVGSLAIEGDTVAQGVDTKKARASLCSLCVELLMYNADGIGEGTVVMCVKDEMHSSPWSAVTPIA